MICFFHWDLIRRIWLIPLHLCVFWLLISKIIRVKRGIDILRFLSINKGYLIVQNQRLRGAHVLDLYILKWGYLLLLFKLILNSTKRSEQPKPFWQTLILIKTLYKVFQESLPYHFVAKYLQKPLTSKLNNISRRFPPLKRTIIIQ